MTVLSAPRHEQQDAIQYVSVEKSCVFLTNPANTYQQITHEVKNEACNNNNNNYYYYYYYY